MPLPQNCTIDDDVCCPEIFAIGNFILNHVWDSLQSCLPTGCNGSYARYVTLGFGDDGIMDALSVEFNGLAPSPGSINKAGRMNKVNIWRGAYTVRLRESGWPIAKIAENTGVPPDPVRQHALAALVYSHGERMFRILRDMVVHDGPWLNGYPPFPNLTLRNLNVLTPEGGVVGFAATIECNMPFGVGGL